jgi:hypothetical protein
MHGALGYHRGGTRDLREPGVAGWYFEPRGHDVTNMCANEQAQCGERRL